MIISSLPGHARRTAVLAATAALFTAGFSAATVAPASAAPEECGVDELCTWVDGNFVGAFSRTFVPPYPSGFCGNVVNPRSNDTSSSVVNRSSRTILFYADADCQGEFLVIPPNTQIADFGAFNDKHSSFKF